MFEYTQISNHYIDFCTCSIITPNNPIIELNGIFGRKFDRFNFGLQKKKNAHKSNNKQPLNDICTKQKLVIYIIIIFIYFLYRFFSNPIQRSVHFTKNQNAKKTICLTKNKNPLFLFKRKTKKQFFPRKTNKKQNRRI